MFAARFRYIIISLSSKVLYLNSLRSLERSLALDSYYLYINSGTVAVLF